MIFFVVPFLHNLPNVYFKLVPYPVVFFTFLTLGKILVEIFTSYCCRILLRNENIHYYYYFSHSSTSLSGFVFFYTGTTVKISPN